MRLLLPNVDISDLDTQSDGHLSALNSLVRYRPVVSISPVSAALERGPSDRQNLKVQPVGIEPVFSGNGGNDAFSNAGAGRVAENGLT